MFKGSIVAIATPFKNGVFDRVHLKNLLNFK